MYKFCHKLFHVLFRAGDFVVVLLYTWRRFAESFVSHYLTRPLFPHWKKSSLEKYGIYKKVKVTHCKLLLRYGFRNWYIPNYFFLSFKRFFCRFFFLHCVLTAVDTSLCGFVHFQRRRRKIHNIMVKLSKYEVKPHGCQPADFSSPSSSFFFKCVNYVARVPCRTDGFF